MLVFFERDNGEHEIAELQTLDDLYNFLKERRIVDGQGCGYTYDIHELLTGEGKLEHALRIEEEAWTFQA